MKVKYSIFRCAMTATGVCAALLLAFACTDDFGYQDHEGKRVAFKLSAPDTWHEGMSVNENAPTTHCTSVRALSGGDTKLYLHTVVADNPVEEKTAVTRGTPVRDKDTFTKTYSRFSLSGICYTGEYPTDESQNTWTTEYAHDLYYNSASGKPEKEGGRPLLWPANGQVRFFAFAPIVEDFESLADAEGSLALSEAGSKGSPTLTYTVPKDVTKQVDLMTARETVKAATTPEVVLKFGHALTAVQIKCGTGMLAGKITEVTISGIYGTGTQVIGDDEWETSDITSYTISEEIQLSPKEGATDKIHVPGDTPIAGTETDNLTFMLLPQTLPDGATMTIKFTDKATNTERTLTASIAGHEWKAGKIVTYSVSPSSINIKAKVDLNKKSATAENPGDIMPYSGVWYDAKYTAKAEVVQNEVGNKIEDITVTKFQYKLENETDWQDCTTDADGLLKIASQPAYETMRNGFETTTETGSESSPVPLTVNGKTANCYLVDKAGYFSLPLVYGNGNVSEPYDNTNGLKYYPKHDDERMPADGKISGVSDAVLCWQDAPDLIDPASVTVDGENLVFHIRKHTLTQGNALLAVRNDAKEIIWSWHIWVTPYKEEFYGSFYNSSADGYSYNLAKYNLGWCDRHDHNASRTFSLRAIVDMSAYGGKKETEIPIGTFTQDVFKGSDAGDNTYYQWGRKDPMLGGIYNAYTPKYQYNKKFGTSKETLDKDEFTMENKQVFNQYNQGGYNYSFCKNPGDVIEPYVSYGQSPGEASKGVTIGYGIKHPYMFVTNSSEYDTDGTFNYRNHWHIPYADYAVQYLNEENHIMFNAWNSGATGAGYQYGSTGTLDNNAAIVTKSVYDPCPPEFQMPPIHALKAVYDKISSTSASYAYNAWTITSDGGSIKFPVTGVRNNAVRSTDWNTVVQLNPTEVPYETFCEDFYKTSMPAFSMLTYLSSATIVYKGDNDAYQVYLFGIDINPRDNTPSTSNLKRTLTASSNSYGLSVRPMHYTEGK